MKVILRAFGNKLVSEPLDFPDNVCNEFSISLPLDVITQVQTVHWKLLETTGSTIKVCRFIFDGHFDYEGNEKIRCYTLVDIN